MCSVSNVCVCVCSVLELAYNMSALKDKSPLLTNVIFRLLRSNEWTFIYKCASTVGSLRFGIANSKWTWISVLFT